MLSTSSSRAAGSRWPCRRPAARRPRRHGGQREGRRVERQAPERCPSPRRARLGEKRAKSEKLSISVASTPTVSPIAAKDWHHCSPADRPASPPPRVQRDGPAGLPSIQTARAIITGQIAGPAGALELPYGLHALADDQRLDGPEQQEGDPAQGVQPEEAESWSRTARPGTNRTSSTLSATEAR